MIKTLRNFLLAFTLISTFSFSSLSYAQTSPHSTTICDCFEYNGLLNRNFSQFIISERDPKAFDYPYYLINLELSKKLIKKPIYFFEYHNNFYIHNKTLHNGLNFNLKKYSIYPEFYKDRKARNPEEFNEQHNLSLKNNDLTIEMVKDNFRWIYRSCYKAGHNNPLTLYDHGFLAYIEGNVLEAMECAEKYNSIRKNNNNENFIYPVEEHLLAQTYLELTEYSKAIEILSELIKNNPTDKEAYFNRAIAYFETGQFDLSLNDFNISEKQGYNSSSKLEASLEFTKALMGGLTKGSLESIKDYVPSLCSTAYGLGCSLWVGVQAPIEFVQAPIESSKNFANACCEICDCLSDYYKNFDQTKIDEYKENLDEYKEIVEEFCIDFNNFTEKEKGEFIGYNVGKYGVDFFAGGALAKGAQAYRNLKRANALCNIEAMVLSTAQKEQIIASSLKHAAERDLYFSNTKINWNHQGKHLPTKHNFIKTKGIISLEEKELESLMKLHSGKGQRISGPLGEAGYKERVDFGKIIGDYALQKDGKFVKHIPTTKGIIHYAKDGLKHLVPSRPTDMMD